jgi:hypothetical protein
LPAQLSSGAAADAAMDKQMTAAKSAIIFLLIPTPL